ncbi:MAG TPA: hypothetical protein VEL76_23360 [Gemmataceae bacterium]|nr:hypothetical protein [Gemmataceae bacterium]
MPRSQVEPTPQPTVLQQFIESAKAARETVKAISDSPHMAPVHALIRQGADEVAQLRPAFPDSNVRNQGEPGQMFEPTPQLITEQMTGRQVNLEMDR